MTTYQLVPYLVSVAVRQLPDEMRALDNLFAGGEQLSEELGSLLAAHVGQLVEQPRAESSDPKKRPLRVQTLSVGVADRQLSAVVAPGKSGVESTVRSRSGSTYERKFEDTELVPLRHHLLYPQSGKRAILFAERVGGNGAIAALAAMLRQTWASRHPDTVLHIAPAMAEDAFRGSLESRPIKSLVFSRTRGPNGGLAVGRHDVEYSLKVKPRRRGSRWHLSEFVGGDGKDGQMKSTSLLSEVAPVLGPGADRHAAAARLLEDGWTVAVELDLPGNISRTVYVDQSTSSTMSFPVIDGELEPAARPTEPNIAEAVRRIVGDGLLDGWGMPASIGASVNWNSAPWTESRGWGVNWDVIAD